MRGPLRKPTGTPRAAPSSAFGGGFFAVETVGVGIVPVRIIGFFVSAIVFKVVTRRLSGIRC